MRDFLGSLNGKTQCGIRILRRTLAIQLNGVSRSSICAQDVGLGLPSHTQARVTPQDSHGYLEALEGLFGGSGCEGEEVSGRITAFTLGRPLC